MGIELSLEALTKDNASSVLDFKCDGENGEAVVEQFLKDDALRLQEQGMVSTKLAYTLQGALVGYYSLFCSNVPKLGRDKIRKEGWDVPEGEKFYPSVRLHYLGVSQQVQRLGIGTDLWYYVLDDCLTISKLTGCVFIVIEALDDAVGFYERLGFISIGRRYGIVDMVYPLNNANW